MTSDFAGKFSANPSGVYKPYVIAEIGVNHEGSLDLAKQLIELARDGGADAAKFQSYKASTLASKNSPSYWDTTKEATPSQYQLFKKYDNFTASDYVSLAQHCNKVGIDFLSTPFDDESVDFLSEIMPYFKIASADLTNAPLLKRVAAKGKPIILSTGASSLSEIDYALDLLQKNGSHEVALLHCILNYPTEDRNANLEMIRWLKRAYPHHIIGYSDHTVPDYGLTSLMTAYMLGALILEKHFTHDKTLPGNDHYHAMDKNDLISFVNNIEKVMQLRGTSCIKAPISEEQISRSNARRSIVLRTDLNKGAILKDEDLICKRPGTGISPLFWNDVIGKSVNKDLSEDHILQWHDIY